MAFTTLNWTGRRRLDQKNLDLSIREESGRLWLSGRIELPGLDVGSLIVELYRGQERYRANLGTISSTMMVNESFPAFASPTAVLCEVKVVDDLTDRGVILASSPKVRPTLADDDGWGRSLLAVEPKELGEALWEVQLDDDLPILCVNNRLDDWRGFVRTPAVARLILPEVARIVARWLLDHLDEDEEGGNQQIEEWRGFFMRLGCDDPRDVATGDADATDDWISDSVRRFAEVHRFTTTWLSELDAE